MRQSFPFSHPKKLHLGDLKMVPLKHKKNNAFFSLIWAAPPIKRSVYHLCKTVSIGYWFSPP